MAEYFLFAPNDAFLANNLTAEEIRGIRTWQDARLNYEFSLHTMHDAGWPIYVIESGKRGKRGRPKYNTKDKQANQLQIIGNDLPGIGVRDDSLAVVSANMELFQKLAQEYYEGRAEDEQTSDTWLIEWICDSANCSSKAPRKVLQEVDAEERYLDTDFFQQLSMGALGRCKICKQRVWKVSDIRARDREADKKIDLPLSLLREYEKSGKAKAPEDY